MLWLLFVLALLFFLAELYWNLTHYFNYWTKRGVRGPKPSLQSIFVNLFQFKYTVGQACSLIYNSYPNEKIVGIFNGGKPVILLRNYDLVKDILIKDFSYFVNRGLALSIEPFSENLFINQGDSWKVIRQQLTPAFTSGKLKNMFYLLKDCAVNFQKYVDEVIDTNEVHEMKDIVGRYTLGAICSCGFGIEVDALKSGKNHFEEMGKYIFEPTWFRSFLISIDVTFPGILKILNKPIVPKKLVQFFEDLVGDIVQERDGKPKVRQDFMDLMLTLREQKTIPGIKRSSEKEGEEIVMTDRTMAAQAFIFYAGGFETSSATISFMLHELALNKDIQHKLRTEVNSIAERYHGLTYEALQDMPYMDLVLKETLRKYPVFESLHRECVQSYMFSGTDVKIDKGVKVVIPVLAFHRDPKYYPEPEVFDPERFSAGKFDAARPYLPFGDGPRNCIGGRFAKVQMMLGIAHFLQKFGVRPCARTTPILELHPMTFTMSSAHGIWLEIYRV